METLGGYFKVSNLVLREHMKFIKDTLMEKLDVLLEWGIFLINYKLQH
jgi:hypothetical protein